MEPGGFIYARGRAGQRKEYSRTENQLSNPENVPETSEKPETGTTEETSQQQATASEKPTETSDEGKGSKQAVLADLAKERDARQALAAQLDQLKTGLASALGISQQTEVTPEQLTEQLTQAQKQAKTAETRLAVYQATPAGVDADALLDSQAFNKLITDTTPENLPEVIADFVKTNPRFHAATNTAARDANAASDTAETFSMNDWLRNR